ncbi:zinc finger HIT domain-containing protein 2 [Trichonephila clavata]|uniref:Zinc finger HIT domain-containing protein 2 n=1 Tax=Trichonephila clavata TaxID=2740835 RepID=A0A8X6KYP5_TRICU|nr:zinc finger HIT domain-containing protein 2 [Trichonephila clavata]
MSLSKVAPNCIFCGLGKGIYSCPRCNRKYCSSQCYKSRDHAECSESFFREWVQQSLQEKSSDRVERENMLQMLKKFEAENIEDHDKGNLPIEDRFAGLNINDADENVIWQSLNDEEKEKFKTLIEDASNLEDIISVKQPWWSVTVLNLVTETDAEKSDFKDDVAPRPCYPLNTKKLSDLTSAKPSNCIQYNLVNVLYSYAFLYRFYNCDLRDFLEDAVDFIFQLSPVLSEGHNYFSLEESIQDSIRIISSSEFNVPLNFVKSIIDDLRNIMQGPDNAKSSTFVLCALHDIKLLFLELKYANRDHEDMERKLRKKLLLAAKKIEYFMSWCLDFESTLSDIASDLVLLMLPELVPDIENNEYENNILKSNEKPLIEELD